MPELGFEPKKSSSRTSPSTTNHCAVLFHLQGKMHVSMFICSLGEGRTFLGVIRNPEAIKKKVMEIIKNKYTSKDTKSKIKKDHYLEGTITTYN